MRRRRGSQFNDFWITSYGLATISPLHKRRLALQSSTTSSQLGGIYALCTDARHPSAVFQRPEKDARIPSSLGISCSAQWRVWASQNTPTCYDWIITARLVSNKRPETGVSAEPHPDKVHGGTSGGPTTIDLVRIDHSRGPIGELDGASYLPV